jgi:hypothetical protein
MGRRVITLLCTVGLALLPAEPARACGSRMQGRSPQFSMPQFSLPQTYCQRQQVAMQQYAMRQHVQMLAQQRAVLAAVQQQRQQNALLMAQQPPPNALLMAQQPPRQQPNALPPGLWRPPQPNPGVAQLRPVAEPEPNAPAPQPADPEQVAARQLSIARDLVADADTVRRQGDQDRAALMRERAGERLQDIVARFPKTRAADAAQELLKKLAP